MCSSQWTLGSDRTDFQLKYGTHVVWCCAEACTAAVFICVVRLPGCPFDSAWCFDCEVCRLTVDCDDCGCYLSLCSSAVPGVWSFLRVKHVVCHRRFACRGILCNTGSLFLYGGDSWTGTGTVRADLNSRLPHVDGTQTCGHHCHAGRGGLQLSIILW